MESIHEVEYDQRVFVHDCGSPACLSGHSHFLMKNENTDNKHYGLCINNGEFSKNNNWLGISIEQAFTMFTSEPIEHEDVTKQDAINMLKNFLETGEVVWRKENEC